MWACAVGRRSPPGRPGSGEPTGTSQRRSPAWTGQEGSSVSAPVARQAVHLPLLFLYFGLSSLDGAHAHWGGPWAQPTDPDASLPQKPPDTPEAVSKQLSVPGRQAPRQRATQARRPPQPCACLYPGSGTSGRTRCCSRCPVTSQTCEHLRATGELPQGGLPAQRLCALVMLIVISELSTLLPSG